MNFPDTDIATDVCYRCGYDLRATPDDRPCPECGLLAARSRRPSDELRYTRPAWLWSLAAGAVLILVSMAATIAWWGGLAVLRHSDLHYSLISSFGITPQMLAEWSDWGLAVVAGIFLVAIFLLTRAEKYPPADRADRWLRWGLWIAALAPLAAAVLEIIYWVHRRSVIHSIYGNFSGPSGWTFYTPFNTYHSAPFIYYTMSLRGGGLPLAAFYVATLGTSPLPVLLFLRLRGLAKRARSARLAEHCLIVGVGATAAILYFTGYAELNSRVSQWGWGQYWSTNSETSLWLTTILGTISLLFGGWAIVLLVRFTISFVAAADEILREGPPAFSSAPQKTNAAYPAIAEAGQDLCYRCGYDLRATPDDHPCPECGLLAARSRRESDELRHSRPRWLAQLAVGSSTLIAAILVALVIFALEIVGEWKSLRFRYDLSEAWLLMSVLVAAGVAFLAGIYLLTQREGYLPADLADQRGRKLLRAAAMGPLAGAILGLLYCTLGRNPSVNFIVPAPFIFNSDPIPALGWASLLVATMGDAPLAILLFLHLRGLAKRARSAQLAEHCVIVGTGAALSLVYLGGYIVLVENASAWGWADDWSLNSPVLFYATLALLVSAALFLLWSFYLLFRFTRSFIAAALAIHKEQGREDSSLTGREPAAPP